MSLLDVIEPAASQLRVGYDASNYADFTASSGGDLTIAPTGGDTTVTGTLTVSSTLAVTGQTTFSDFIQGTEANGYIHLRGDSGATSGFRITDAPVFLFGHTVTTGASAKDAVLANGAWLRGVTAAGTTSYNIVQLSSSDELRVGQSDRAINLLGNNVFFNNVGTTASAANAFLDGASANNLKRSTSSVRYKTIVRQMDTTEALTVIAGLDPMIYRSKASGDDPDREFVGMTAEAAYAVDPRYVHLSEDGLPDGFMYERLVVPLTVLVRDQQARIAALEAQLAP